MIVGTAGHIDHGKSSLVTALTGRSMDRLAEERRRGITIDLGFAPLDLGDGRRAGVVDVPGHEDFVRTMVAGASGIDAALLVVAADEGIMPQTEEHLAILEYLRIPVGVAAVTKADLVDPDWLELVLLEVDERLARSSVRFEASLAVSAVTGEGLDALRLHLREMADGVAGRPASAPFRMPLDRAFSIAGIGTVITGTAWTGSVGLGDMVLVLPGGCEGRIRSIETHGQPVERSTPGARTALGVSGLERSALRRGDTVVTADYPWIASGALDVEVALDPRAPRALVPRTRVRVHLGTAEVMARIYPRGPLEPGGAALARLALETPLVAGGGDRFVLRSYSPLATIAGGWVVDPDPPPRTRSWPASLTAAEPGERARALLARRGDSVPTAVLPLLLGLTPDETAKLLKRDRGVRRGGGHWFTLARLEAVAADAIERAAAHHRREPSSLGVPLETLRRSLHAPAHLVDLAIAEHVAAGRLVVEAGSARLPGFRAGVSGGDGVIDAMVDVLEEAGLAPPSVAELVERFPGRDVAAALRLAAGRGRIEAVERDRYYTPAALERYVAVLREIGAAGPIVPATVRDRLGVTRKFLIPLLEWADRTGITYRSGDARLLVKPARSPSA